MNNTIEIPKFINKNKEVKVIKKVTQTKTTKEINHKIIEHNDKEYIVAYTPYKDEHILFVFDADDKEKVCKLSWCYYADGKYIGKTHYDDDDNKKALYLHNFIMNKLTFEGKGQQHTVDHINRVGRDNRKENLRMATSQSAQNFNTKKRERKIELPEGCDITSDMIPRNVWYIKPNGKHGDGFCIEIKGVQTLNEGRFTWKSTRSTKVSLKVKLHETKLKLEEIAKNNPELQELSDLANEERRNELIQSFNAILEKSSYPEEVIKSNLVQLITDAATPIVINNNEEQMAKTVTGLHASGKKTNKLPQDSGVTPDMIPKYCYYSPANDKSGDNFVIDRHPGIGDKKRWTTSTSKKVNTITKFESLIEKLKEIEIKE
jgi:hypothetical protein